MPLTFSRRRAVAALLAGIGAALASAPAGAETDFRARLAVSATGFFESGGTVLGLDPGNGMDRESYDQSSPQSLGWLDLKADLLARKIADTNFTVKVDFRLRIARDYPPPQLYLPDVNEPPLQVPPNRASLIGRGYRGGPEEDLRELYVNYANERFTATLGRVILQEAAAVQFDGATAGLNLNPAWQAGLFGGLFPDPFSRSDFRSYSASNFTGGAYASYRYKNLWGSLAAYVVYLTGSAGPLDPLVGINGDDQLTEPIDTEGLRFFVFWQDYIRPTQTVDVYTYLLLQANQRGEVDVHNGSIMANLRVGPNWRFQLHYGHFSALAFETFLRDLQRCDPASLALRQSQGLQGCLRNSQVGQFATMNVGDTALNNLEIRRVSREDVRVHADYNWGGRWTLYAEPRFRLRSLDEVTYQAGSDGNYAIDITVGFRDRQLPLALNLHAAYTYIFNYVSQNHLVRVQLGRDFGERGFAELAFGFQYNDDSLIRTEPYGQGTRILLEGGASGGVRFLKDFLAYAYVNYFYDDGIRALLGVVRLEYRL